MKRLIFAITVAILLSGCAVIETAVQIDSAIGLLRVGVEAAQEANK